MNLIIILKVALRSLRRTVLRSLLTMLGIIIGVSAVIAMVGIGNGAKAKMQSYIAGIDQNNLTLYAVAPRSMWTNGSPIALPPSDGLRADDYEAIREKITGFVASTPEIVGGGELHAKVGSRSIPARITGIDCQGLSVIDRTVEQGTDFGAVDITTAAPVCLVSATAASELAIRGIGGMVSIGGQPFVVIGILADDRPGKNRTSEMRDYSIYLPYTSILRRLKRNPFLTISLKVSDPTQISKLQQDVADLLEERRGGRKAEFMFSDQADLVKRYLDSGDTMTILLGSIAGISLLVGGIGIMNIMLVSVTERTREIGIRLAIGTRSRDILRQFVIEAVVLSVLGGLAGIVFGVTAAKLLTRFYGWPTEITVAAIVGSFMTSVAIGVFFGWYPARHAARLDPVEALRHE